MVERADINSVLMQMRALQAQAQQGVSPIQAPGVQQGPEGVDSTGFGELLKNAVNKVNDLQGDAKKLAVSCEQGDPAVDLPQVMISMEKASVSFEAMTQVRNRLVSAYEDIMKMPM